MVRSADGSFGRLIDGRDERGYYPITFDYDCSHRTESKRAAELSGW